MRVTVLGASGFLGRAICKELGLAGIQTTAVARGFSDRLPVDEQITVSDYANLPENLTGSICIHLATPGTLQGLDDAQISQVSEQSLELLSTLKKRNFAKIIFASSAVVYGDQLGRPAKETDATSASGAYAKLKIDCEGLLDQKLDLIVRIANVYGVGMSKLNVLSDLLYQIPRDGRHRDVYYLRTLSPVRDYLAVEDVAKAFCRMTSTHHSGIFNIGSGLPRSVLDIAEVLLAEAGLPEAKLKATSENNRPSYLVLDPSRAARDLQWSPECDIQNTFQKLLEDYRKNPTRLN